MNSAYLLNLIKDELKLRKITYKRLSEKINISEAGVKKMFQTGDTSISRLLSICKVLNLKLEALIYKAANKPVEDIYLDKKQQSFFKNNPSYFFFYLKLVYENSTPEEIKDDFKLSEKKLWNYLKKLDDLKLIKLEKENRAKFNYSYMRQLKTEGRVFEKMKTDLAINFLNRIYESNKPDSNYLMMSLYKMSEENICNLKKDIFNLLESYQRKSEIDQSDPFNTNIKKFSLLFGQANFSFISGIEK